MISKVFRAATSAAVLAILGALPSAGLQAQQGRGEVEEGNRLYEEGRFPEAHARYLEALRKAPGNPLIRFNEGNALYRSDEFERALEAYGEVIGKEGSGLDPQAWYNLGNALVRQQQLPEALEAYKEALRRDPADVDAKHNLELVLQQMEQDEQNDQNENDEDQSNEDQENPDQQNQDGSNGGDQNQQNPESSPDEGDGESDQQGRPEDQEGQGEPNPDPGQGEGSEGGGQPLPPGQMTREEAERLLQAVQEDPGEVDRQGSQQRGRRPRKDW